jgi:diguanylate cyclase (GGDEF)-like protein
VSSKDEIGRLAQSFNRMVLSLRETMASRDELTAEIEKRREIEEELKVLSTVDELTQLYNRRAFNDFLAQMIVQAQRYNEPLSIAMLDFDHFKKINDRLGHTVGDSVLKQLAEIIQANIRASDVLARWGGEEFILLMPKITLADAARVMDRLRLIVADEEFVGGSTVTISVGVTELRPGDGFDDLLKRVDEAQYRAKASGRNNVQTI